MTSRLKNGRFVRKCIKDRINKAAENLSAAKKRKIENIEESLVDEVPDENGIITWKILAKNLKCTDCKSLLDLEKMSNFKREGLHSQFIINCQVCNKPNLVDTGVKNDEVSDINSSVILGAIHSGVGNTSLNKILACANLPRINDYLYKKYENIIGNAVESEAKESCKRAAAEERKLVIENTKKLCDTL